jgi:hypothetical protein
VAAAGGSYQDDAIALGGQAYAELELGRRLRWLSYARLAEDRAIADGIERRHLELTAALRVGRSRRDYRFAVGNGYYLGVTMRERQGARFWGLVIGHSLDAARCVRQRMEAGANAALRLRSRTHGAGQVSQRRPSAHRPRRRG